ncbi:UNVERIFIED_ORG: bacterial RNA polymerase [Salmonella phage PSP2-22]
MPTTHYLKPSEWCHKMWTECIERGDEYPLVTTWTTNGYREVTDMSNVNTGSLSVDNKKFWATVESSIPLRFQSTRRPSTKLWS